MKTALEQWIELAKYRDAECPGSTHKFYVKEAVKGFIADSLEAVKASFIEKVWCNDLFAFIDSQDTVRHSGEFGKSNFVMMYFIGRIVMTFTCGDSDVTIVAVSDGAKAENSGFQSFHGDIFEMRDAIQEVIDNWDINKLEKGENIGFG